MLTIDDEIWAKLGRDDAIDGNFDKQKRRILKEIQE